MGACVVLLAALPVYRVLSGAETGLAGASTIHFADIFASFLWTGALLVLLASLLAMRFLPRPAVASALTWARAALMRPRTTSFAAACGTIACALSVAFVLLALRAQPNHIDALSQLLHARFFTQGMLAGPADIDYAFWHIQNSVVTPRGWVSQYPPGHVVLLAAGLLARAPWTIGPIMVGATALFVALIADRLLPERPALARAGALLVAVSAFVICLGGSFMNHASATAFLAATAYFAVKAVQDGTRWAFAAGAAMGYAFTIRPLTALAVGGATAAAAWLGSRRAAGLLGRAAVGALPFMALLAAYNTYFFGRPMRFGYDVALGPGAGLGFQRDPWGNLYGPLQAIGYTSADLLMLGAALLETPISAVIIAGLLLMFVNRLTHGERILAAWALTPVAANALYWHHGMYMGPRMLFEAAPAWVLLAVLGVGRAFDALPEVRTLGRIRLSPRTGFAGGAALALAIGLFWSAPQRALGYIANDDAVVALRTPETDGPALVFVHDGWTARIAMQLAGAGMRLDSVETALRQNPTCAVQALVDAVVARDDNARAAALARLDLEPRASGQLQVVQIARGNTMRVAPGELLTPACTRQANADRNGILDIAPLLWRGDLPGGRARGPMFVRDLGPERNAELIARMAERTPMMLYLASDDALPTTQDYALAMDALWNVAPDGDH